MEQGKGAGRALMQLLVAGPNPAVRQAGMIDANGNIARHTSDNCIRQTGNRGR
jgi:uncharacterized Ntn-hydrolase superfamily protein